MQCHGYCNKCISLPCFITISLNQKKSENHKKSFVNFGRNFLFRQLDLYLYVLSSHSSLIWKRYPELRHLRTSKQKYKDAVFCKGCRQLDCACRPQTALPNNNKILFLARKSQYIYHNKRSNTIK